MAQSTGSAPQITIPQLGTPLVDPNGGISAPWYRVFIDMWKRSGGSQGSAATQAYLGFLPDGSIGVYSSDNNALVGTLSLTPTGSPAPVVLNLNAAPFNYVAPYAGTLVVSSGTLTLTRGGIATQVSLVGGALPMSAGDQATINWYNAAPSAVFYGG